MDNEVLNRVDEMSKLLIRDIRDVKEGLAALLTDRDCLSIYSDIDWLTKAIESVSQKADNIKLIIESAGKEHNN